MTSIGSSSTQHEVATIAQPREAESATQSAVARERPTRFERLEALAEAVRRWLADPRYVTEQLMIRALKELERD
jgi:hypothetical protein